MKIQKLDAPIRGHEFVAHLGNWDGDILLTAAEAEALMRGLAAELGYTAVKLDEDFEKRLEAALNEDECHKKTFSGEDYYSQSTAKMYIMHLLKGGGK